MSLNASPRNIGGTPSIPPQPHGKRGKYFVIALLAVLAIGFLVWTFLLRIPQTTGSATGLPSASQGDIVEYSGALTPNLVLV